jgi:hypothetical protein
MAPILAAFRLLAVAALIRGTIADPAGSSRRAPSGAYLFGYETKQLTDAALARLSADEQTLFGFDDSAVKSGPSRRSGECKLYPGDDAWPSEQTWDRFDALVDGNLIPTIPLAAPCYSNWGVYDSAKCAAITAKFTDPYTQ